MISPLDERYLERLREIEVLSGEKELYRLYWDLEKIYLRSFLEIFGIHICANDVFFQDAYFDHFVFEEIKEEEKKTNHDIFAVINVLKRKIKWECKPSINKSFVHFGLTSSDIKGVAETIRLLSYLNAFNIKTKLLKESLLVAKKDFDRPVLSYTHGQVATPYDFNDFLDIHYSNLGQSLFYVNKILSEKIDIKIGGANGFFNCLVPIFSNNISKIHLLKKSFVAKVNNEICLKDTHIFYSGYSVDYESTPTTQISGSVQVGNILSGLKVVLLKLVSYSQDVWMLNSLGVISLRSTSDEIGSSTMPHKINPIEFENAEGNLRMSIALIDEMIPSLLVSRLGRDLSSSTVLRNMSTMMGHIFLALGNLASGTRKIKVNEEHIDQDKKHYAVLSEYYQIILRFIGHEYAYDKLKKSLRGSDNPQKEIHKMLSAPFDNQSTFKNLSELLEFEGFKILTKPSEYAALLKDWR